ncbi:MAG: pentapeptide repeat-containing protein [Planctomycetes bacterium]|jgi:uncharacterized protein YjbI with pentapeptide repeats|nr:pentapeptide repeat-containing protein [Planctomycetota bacterium]
MPGLEPQRAAVRPRIRIEAGGVPRLLEEEIAELLAAGRPTTVHLLGGRGAGKTTALAHIAFVFAGDVRLGLRDGAPTTTGDFLVVVTATPRGVLSRPPARPGERVFHLMPWNDDDCLEYLCTRHPTRTAAAWNAWRAGNAEHDLRQHPALCTRVLDHLASAAAPADALQALHQIMLANLGDARAAAQHNALSTWLRQPGHAEHSLPADTAPWFRSSTARAQLAAEQLLQLAAVREPFALQHLVWRRDLAIAVITLLQLDPARAEALHARIGIATDADDRLALSLLAIAAPGYRPPAERLVDGSHAMLSFAVLEGRELSGNWSHAHLFGAVLRAATLDHCLLVNANLADADLSAASLRQAQALDCIATGLRAGNLIAEAANFRGANFARAQLQGAKLMLAAFDHGRLDDADLTGADLTSASLLGTDLRTTRLDGAILDYALCDRACASETQWPALQAEDSQWRDADLTGARWPRAKLQRASFRGARLADVDWSGADLRGADLSGATFHLGNSRSGLVGSELASEGTRTGFYTDESLERHFQQPELVRKANLGGCDLRGANLVDTDLYLVDLRGAKLDPRQREHARRCRAILDRRETT